VAPPPKKSRAQLAIEEAERGDALPPPNNMYWVVDPTRERPTFAERIAELQRAERDQHPQAFYDENDDGSADIIDLRGDQAPVRGSADNAGSMWPGSWPPVDWAPPPNAEPGSLTTSELPTTGQLIKRAVEPYSTPLTHDENIEFNDFVERHPDLLELDEDPDRPAYDYQGWWKATQREGATGPDSRRGIEYWETPYSETFSSNKGGKYTLHEAPALPNTRAAIVDRAANPYRTQLSPAEEKEFQQWRAVTNAPHVDSRQADYDMRGFFKALREGDPRATTAVNPSDGQIHYPDDWKTPFHRTFSDRSIYAQPGAPSWHGDALVSPDGRIIHDAGGPQPKPVAPPARPKTIPERPQTLRGVIEDWTGRFSNRPGDEEEALWTGKRGPAAPRDLPLASTQPTPQESTQWHPPPLPPPRAAPPDIALGPGSGGTPGRKE
jgi:hypothetical protein